MLRASMTISKYSAARVGPDRLHAAVEWGYCTFKLLRFWYYLDNKIIFITDRHDSKL